MQHPHWYRLKDDTETDSPALLVYPDRIRHNITGMIRIAGDPGRLIPHVKTHKMAAIVKLQLAQGITRFKCATIAEAEMAAGAGAREVVLAYQLNPAKAGRFIRLMQAFPGVRFASLVDNRASAVMLGSLYQEAGLTGAVFVDVDNGMHRTGFPATGDLAGFYRTVSRIAGLRCRGLHVYDGHIHEPDVLARERHAEEGFRPVAVVMAQLCADGETELEVIAGGSPTFPLHAANPAVSCSPGTSVLWDEGYATLLAEQPFLPAAVLMTRIVSHEVDGQITVDLGHKSVAAENPLDRRITFLNLEGCRPVSQSEEHLVLRVSPDTAGRLAVGDTLYGIPYHICPSVALYDDALVVEDGRVTGRWEIAARRKQNRF